MEGAVMADGSGLSRLNLVTSRQLARLLHVMASSPYYADFSESLPIMSIDGTLSRRLKGSRASGLIRAKTGTMAGVRSLSGYLTTYNNDNLIFSIISNNHDIDSRNRQGSRQDNPAPPRLLETVRRKA